MTAKQEKQRRRYARHRAVVDGYKNVPCADCGARWPAPAMDFDHLENPSFKIGSSALLSLKRLEAEIAKCEVVCACCHRLRTVARGQQVSRG